MQVAVIIPVYKAELSAVEKGALLQCKKVLGRYSIQLLAPASLDLSSYFELLEREVPVKRFKNSYFKSVKGYSRLLLSRKFYKAFLEFDYILIYQLDAWVFSDKLQEWVNKGYDYIGAPWVEIPPAGGKVPLINLSKCLINKVGNGGLSLRRVRAHYNWAIWTRIIFFLLPKNEDFIWTLFTNMRKPDVQEALHFAFELDPRGSLKRTKEILPFGCHAWEKYDPAFWHPFITIDSKHGK